MRTRSVWEVVGYGYLVEEAVGWFQGWETEVLGWERWVPNLVSGLQKAGLGLKHESTSPVFDGLQLRVSTSKWSFLLGFEGYGWRLRVSVRVGTCVLEKGGFPKELTFWLTMSSS